MVRSMSVRGGRLLAAVAVATGAVTPAMLAAPTATAAPCPDVEVVFARGTFEEPGVGGVGERFVDALRSRLGGKDLAVYPVDYPASTDFPTAADGVIDASNHMMATAARCPGTKMVLGGFSQGAAVAGYVTADAIPAGFTPPQGITGPMPAHVADHVAAVTLFGEPSPEFLDDIAAPPIVIGARYAPKTLTMCIPSDPICCPTGADGAAHGQYGTNGMTTRAAEFAASRLNR